MMAFLQYLNFMHLRIPSTSTKRLTLTCFSCSKVLLLWPFLLRKCQNYIKSGRFLEKQVKVKPSVFSMKLIGSCQSFILDWKISFGHVRLGSLHKLRLHFLAFDHLPTPPSLHFLCSKFSIFLTTYPPLNANVICDGSLRLG